jgi:hypothetical protein
MIRTAIRALSLALGLAMFLALPAAAAEPAPHCAVPTSALVGAIVPVSLPEIFGTVPAPQPMSGYVSCDQCPGGPSGPYRQCHVYCWSNYGWCVDQCYAYADTCQLSNCICLPC